MWSFKAWRRRRVLERDRRIERLWPQLLPGLPLLQHLTPEEQGRLRQLATLFLNEKSLEPAGDLLLDEPTRASIALLAALPVLGLDADWYTGWHSVIIYPDTFVSDHEAMDEAGVVHRIREARSGEAWEHGPVILSWGEIRDSAAIDGYNVVIHEMAHKLDGLNGPLNGMPPLHAGMDPGAWSEAFSAAYEDLCERVDAGEETDIDPYASESPAEFFAVLSETFFELPWLVDEVYPAVYRQLKAFYRQDPLPRFE